MMMILMINQPTETSPVVAGKRYGDIKWGRSVWGKRRSGGQEHAPTDRLTERKKEGRLWGREGVRDMYLPCTPCTPDPAPMHLGLHLHPSSQPADAPQWPPLLPRCCRADGLGWLGWHRVSIDFAQSAAGAAPDRIPRRYLCASRRQASSLNASSRTPIPPPALGARVGTRLRIALDPPSRRRAFVEPTACALCGCVCVCVWVCLKACVVDCLRGEG